MGSQLATRSGAAAEDPWSRRIGGQDWAALGEALDAQGVAVMRGLLDPVGLRRDAAAL